MLSGKVDVVDQQAVTQTRLKRYALIRMDMQMPHLNGGDATLQIRILSGYAKTPILAMNAMRIVRFASMPT